MKRVELQNFVFQPSFLHMLHRLITAFLISFPFMHIYTPSLAFIIMHIAFATIDSEREMVLGISGDMGKTGARVRFSKTSYGRYNNIICILEQTTTTTAPRALIGSIGRSCFFCFAVFKFPSFGFVHDMACSRVIARFTRTHTYKTNERTNERTNKMNIDPRKRRQRR
jgi:hypothetical protein